MTASAGSVRLNDQVWQDQGKKWEKQAEDSYKSPSSTTVRRHGVTDSVHGKCCPCQQPEGKASHTWHSYCFLYPSVFAVVDAWANPFYCVISASLIPFIWVQENLMECPWPQAGSCESWFAFICPRLRKHDYNVCVIELLFCVWGGRGKKSGFRLKHEIQASQSSV